MTEDIVNARNTLVSSWLDTYPKVNTAKAYKQRIARLFTFADTHNINMFRFEQNTCAQFAAWLNEHYASNTVNAVLSAVSAFYMWLDGQGLLDGPNPWTAVRRPNATTTAQRWLSPAELAKFCQAARHTSPAALAVSVLLARHGLRVSEAAEARWEDIRRSGGKGVLVIPDSKAGGRRIQLTKGDLSKLRKLSHSTGFILRNQKGGRLGEEMIRRTVKQIASAARIPDAETVGPHVLRRSVAMHWLDVSNGNIYRVSKLLGHESLESAAHYLSLWMDHNDEFGCEAETALDDLMDDDFTPATVTPADVNPGWYDLPLPTL